MYIYLKDFSDRFLALLILTVLIPLFLLIGILIKLDSKGPVFFLQYRLGKKGIPFKIFKFRTMQIDSNYKTTETLASDPRITEIGRFLRKTSLDELPQLINIIKGEMSFIGPRPPLPHFPKKHEDYNEFEKKRFNVKPGLSGLAAVKQREVHDWSQNIPLDVEYVNNISFQLDLKLFTLSVFSFFRTDNIYSK